MTQFLRKAATLLEKAQKHQASLKSLVLSSDNSVQDKKKLMAIICRVLECKHFNNYLMIISHIIDT